MNKSKNKIKVAVIGGGASGLAAVEALQNKKWQNIFDVTIYEKNNYFGGKCCTVYPNGDPCNGQPGGYELGAGVISKGSKRYAHLEALLKKHCIPYSNAAEKKRVKYRFFVYGKPLGFWRLLYFFFIHPFKFLKTLYGLIKLWIDLGDSSKNPVLEYHGRPSHLHKTLFQAYPPGVNICCSFGMQAFGYADLDDPGLSSPLLYYHQYATRDVIINPVYKVDIGMQGIWSTVTSSYPKEMLRLNEEVSNVTRDGKKIIIETASGKETFDYLIVAVPLGPALKFMDFNKSESEFISKIKTNYYITVLCRVKGLTDIGNINILKCVDPDQIGSVVFGYKRYIDSDWITLNLYLKPGENYNEKKILDQVKTSLREDFSAELVEPSSARIYKWPDYFPHLGTDELDDDWYGKFERTFQNKKLTLFVSSGLHMETVGASVEYATIKVNEIAAELYGKSK